MGVNEAGVSAYTPMFSGKPTSWVRDTATLGIRPAWNSALPDGLIVHRDIIILGPQNGYVGRYNVTLNDLQNSSNRATMKAMLIAAATPADTDGDKLPDFWETATYGNLSRTGASLEPNGLTTLQRYAHCGSVPAPGIPEGLPRLVTLPDGSVSLIYTRRRGTAFGLTAVPEFSTNLSAWVASGHSWQLQVPPSPRYLYDGSCGEVLEWKIMTPDQWRFTRVRSTLP
jgi:hypothetical protein